MASGSESGAKGTKLRSSTAASRRSPSYQQTNSNAPNYTPF
jgi:hypothetical protein